jgi:hypothetical protein
MFGAKGDRTYTQPILGPTRERTTPSGDIREHWPTSAADPPPAARRLGSVVSGDAHLCACVIRGEARDHVQCDAPRFCGIPSKWNIERQPMASGPPAALTSIGSRECDESLHLARGPNFEFHARSIGPYLRDGRSRSGNIREHWPSRAANASLIWQSRQAVHAAQWNARSARVGILAQGRDHLSVLPMGR